MHTVSEFLPSHHTLSPTSRPRLHTGEDRVGIYLKGTRRKALECSGRVMRLQTVSSLEQVCGAVRGLVQGCGGGWLVGDAFRINVWNYRKEEWNLESRTKLVMFFFSFVI